MATLTQRTHAVEERTDRLDTVFAAFMARTDAAMARTDESIGRLERIIERREQEGAREREAAARNREEMRQQAERERAESARYREESARERREMNRRWGELANRMGTLVEDIVAPKAVLLNETKTSPRGSDAQDFARFLASGEFALLFPEYQALPIVPVFSSLHIPDDVVTWPTRRGIYALGMGDEDMQVLNLEAVRGQKVDGVGQVGGLSGQTAMV